MSLALPGYFIEKIFLAKIHLTGFSFSICFEAWGKTMEKIPLKWEFSAALFHCWGCWLWGCFHTECNHWGAVFPWIYLSAGVQQCSLPTAVLHVQLSQTCELILPHPSAAGGLLCSPFMSHSIPIIIPRSTAQWLTLGQTGDFQKHKLQHEYFFLLWFIFF